MARKDEIYDIRFSALLQIFIKSIFMIALGIIITITSDQGGDGERPLILKNNERADYVDCVVF
jgi:hypothetical protein